MRFFQLLHLWAEAVTRLSWSLVHSSLPSHGGWFVPPALGGPSGLAWPAPSTGQVPLLYESKWSRDVVASDLHSPSESLRHCLEIGGAFAPLALQASTQTSVVVCLILSRRRRSHPTNVRHPLLLWWRRHGCSVRIFLVSDKHRRSGTNS